MSSKAAAAAARRGNEPIGKLLLINAHMFMRVTVGCSNSKHEPANDCTMYLPPSSLARAARSTDRGVAAVASEPVHALAMCGYDATVAMQLLATSSGISGLVQWLVNPTFGKLSDRYGRRPFFLIGPAWNTVGNFLIAMNPHNKVVHRICCFPLATSVLAQRSC
jgi:MFS-type transporter involved in bile tolerance (Atg22 family)